METKPPDGNVDDGDDGDDEDSDDADDGDGGDDDFVGVQRLETKPAVVIVDFMILMTVTSDVSMCPKDVGEDWRLIHL